MSTYARFGVGGSSSSDDEESQRWSRLVSVRKPDSEVSTFSGAVTEDSETGVSVSQESRATPASDASAELEQRESDGEGAKKKRTGKEDGEKGQENEGPLETDAPTDSDLSTGEGRMSTLDSSFEEDVLSQDDNLDKNAPLDAESSSEEGGSEEGYFRNPFIDDEAEEVDEEEALEEEIEEEEDDQEELEEEEEEEEVEELEEEEEQDLELDEIEGDDEDDEDEAEHEEPIAGPSTRSGRRPTKRKCPSQSSQSSETSSDYEDRTDFKYKVGSALVYAKPGWHRIGDKKGMKAPKKPLSAFELWYEALDLELLSKEQESILYYDENGLKKLWMAAPESVRNHFKEISARSKAKYEEKLKQMKKKAREQDKSQ